MNGVGILPLPVFGKGERRVFSGERPQANCPNLASFQQSWKWTKGLPKRKKSSFKTLSASICWRALVAPCLIMITGPHSQASPVERLHPLLSEAEDAGKAGGVATAELCLRWETRHQGSIELRKPRGWDDHQCLPELHLNRASRS